MTDKEKIRAEIVRHLKEDACGDEIAVYNELLSFIDTMQEEPKSKFEQSIQEGDNIVYNEDLGCRVNLSQLKRVAKKEEPVSEGLEEVAHQYYKPNETFMDGFKKGAKWQKENLWKPADGDDLPEIDREVIVLINYNAQCNIHDEEYPTYRVGFGHRPNPNGWDGKNIDTNVITHYTPKLYDKGGWNAPNIVYWLDARLPYEENKIIKEP